MIKLILSVFIIEITLCYFDTKSLASEQVDHDTNIEGKGIECYLRPSIAGDMDTYLGIRGRQYSYWYFKGGHTIRHLENNTTWKEGKYTIYKHSIHWKHTVPGEKTWYNRSPEDVVWSDYRLGRQEVKITRADGPNAIPGKWLQLVDIANPKFHKVYYCELSSEEEI